MKSLKAKSGARGVSRLKAVAAAILAVALFLPPGAGGLVAPGAAEAAGPAPSRNIAKYRAVYHSSAANYNNTGHLVTDGIFKPGTATFEPAITSQFSDSPEAESAQYAFDGLAATKHYTGHKPEWVQYEFPGGQKHAVSSYAITTANDQDVRDPAQWTLYGVNDDGTLTAVDTVADGALPTARGAAKVFDFENDVAYKGYRFDVTQVRSATTNAVQYAELDLLADGVSAITPFQPRFESYWQSAAAGAQYVYVDLGGQSEFDRVSLQWDAASYARSYSIDVSDDAASWTTVYETAEGAGGAEEAAFSTASGRYVRLSCTAAQGSSYKLYELEVWGDNAVSAQQPPQPPEEADGRQFLTGGNWRVQRASEVSATGAELSAAYDDSGWLSATVPGTVLVSYLNAGAIPDPNYGDQQLQISDSFFTADFWYRDSFTIARSKQGQQIWLNFSNINWKADVYFNGTDVGRIEGAFIRGKFNVTGLANYGEENYLAVYIHKNDTPGAVTVQTADNAGGNGGALGSDNPTIHASVGWDWVPTIRGRNAGIYGDVFLSYSGAVQLADPWVETHLAGVGGSEEYNAAIDASSASLTYRTAVTNTTPNDASATVKVKLLPGDLEYQATVSVPANGSADVEIPFTLDNPRLWWPNRYGDQYLYTCQTSVESGGGVSDAKEFKVGIREMRYTPTRTTGLGAGASAPLSIWVNGARIYCTGGNWGMDESMLRADAEGYDIRVRLHKEEGFTMIRNWVGQTGKEAFYDACDKYGLLVMDDFWLANPGDGPNPNDHAMFVANAVDKLKVVRKHPSVAFYCGRNEGNPPTALNDLLVDAVATHDVSRIYVSNSANPDLTTGDVQTGRTLGGWGAYAVQGPAWYFNNSGNAFHSERGLPNIPAIESISRMIPPDSLWPIPNRMWGLHDFTSGSAQNGSSFITEVQRYGRPGSAEEFSKLAQFVNYENYKALFEAPSVRGNNNRTYNGSGNAMLLWMSQSAWPSMVWQTYDYYYDTNAGYFACKAANQKVNALYDQANNRISIANNSGKAYSNLKLEVQTYSLYGEQLSSVTQTIASLGADSFVASQIASPVPASPTNVNFIQTRLSDESGAQLSENFYWMTKAAARSFTDFGLLDQVRLQTSYEIENIGGVNTATARITNYASTPALMIRVKALTDASGQQILPAYYSDNYFSLMPGQSKSVTVEFDDKYLLGEELNLRIEGYNVEARPFGDGVVPYSIGKPKFTLNGGAQIDSIHPGEIALEANAYFNESATLELTPAIALYKYDQLVEVKGGSRAVSGEAGQSVAIRTEPITVPSGDLSKFVVRGFMWDGDMAPLLPAETLGSWTPPSTNPNLALGKEASSSGVADGTVPANANNGSQGDRWSSAYSNNSWWAVDLGRTYEINRVELFWEAAYAATFRIEVSTEGADGPWTAITPTGADSETIRGVRGGNYPNNRQIVEFDYVEARYVRFYGLTRVTIGNSQYGFSFYEFEVYGKEASEDEIYIDKIDDRDVLNGQQIKFIATASGADGTGVLFSADGLPDGAALDPITGVFDWTPSKDQVGQHTITVRVTNGLKSDAATFKATVRLDISGDRTPPAWPPGAELAVTEIGYSSVTLEWPSARDLETEVAGYEVRLGDAKVASLSADSSLYTVRGLDELTEYSFSVAATDLPGNVSAPLSASATTSEAPEPTPNPDDGMAHAMWSDSYPQNYSSWGESMLAGNGKMGVMVFGNPRSETVIYNDRGFNKSATAARPQRTFNTVSAADVKRIRDYLVAENWAAANDLANSTTGWQDGGDGNRHPGYKMSIGVTSGEGAITGYRRETDFATGEISVSWHDSLGDWERKSFVSRKDNVIVQYLPKPSDGLISCDLQLSIDAGMHIGSFAAAPSVSQDLNYMYMRVLYPDTNTGAGYEGVTRVVTDGAKAANGTALSITGASYVLLLSRTEKYSQGAAAEWGKELVAADLAALPADYSQLRAGNVATHGDIYGRVGLDLNASEEDRALSNEALIAKQKAQTTPVLALYERVFDAGRYHYLSSSWEESPPDLLGVWTGDIDVGWQGFYHLDANVNLQISSGNIGAMPEAMAGYYYLIWGLRDGQLENARKLLGVRGQLGAGNTPGSQSGLISSIANRYYPYHYVTGEMGWLLYPFWENYLITGDKSFLANDLYPLLVDMGYFYEDFLVEVDTAGRYQQGKYIFAGSISPEAQPNGSGGNSLVNNSTFDIAGAKFCLETLIKASKILGKNIENGSVAKWQAILDMLPTYRINSDGALAEWSWPGLNDGYGHRHSSHLITVWPLKDVTAEKSPEYFAAAKETLRRKDQGSYEGAGHGLLHAALNAAGLNNGASLNSKLLSMLRTDFYYTSLSTAHYANKNTFCTDVANTVPGIMMEMLVKSDGGVSDAGVPVDGIVELLPALPEPLVTGTIYGLKNRNRTATEKLTWDMEEGKLAVTLKSDIAQSLTLIEREGIRDIEVTSGTARIAASPLGGIARVVTLPAGQSVTFAITLDTAAAPPAPPTPSDANITQGKPTTAFSESNPQQAAGMATDGSLETRWTSNQNDNDWLRVDLEGSYDVSKVIIHWEAAYGTGYRIQVSNTGGSGQSEWTTVYEATDNQSTDNEIALTNASGGWRYIRLYGLSRATEWGYSIYEFEAYGTPHAG